MQWTTDQDITDAVADIGVTDFIEVKFFENRANGQSKGFCVVSLGSEPSMRMCMEHLPKKELHGQLPVVTLPTKQALNQFESQSKTRLSTPNPGPRGPHPGAIPNHQHQNPNLPPGPHPGQNPNPMPHQGMMMDPQGIRGPLPPPRMPPPGGPPPRMQGPPMQNAPPGQLMMPNQGPPRFQHQPQWNPNGPRLNRPPRPPMVVNQGPGNQQNWVSSCIFLIMVCFELLLTKYLLHGRVHSQHRMDSGIASH